MSDEPENLVLHLLREMREEMATKSDIAQLRAEMATKQDVAELRDELRAEMATKRELADTRKELGEQIVGLRRTLVEYHSVVVGHGSLISDLDARLRRVERHLNLEPSDH